MRLHAWVAILCFIFPLSAGADSLEFTATIFMSVMLQQEFPREMSLSGDASFAFSAQESCNTNLFYAETNRVNDLTAPANLCDFTSHEAPSSAADAAGPITITIAPY